MNRTTLCQYVYMCVCECGFVVVVIVLLSIKCNILLLFTKMPMQTLACLSSKMLQTTVPNVYRRDILFATFSFSTNRLCRHSSIYKMKRKHSQFCVMPMMKRKKKKNETLSIADLMWLKGILCMIHFVEVYIIATYRYWTFQSNVGTKWYYMNIFFFD